MRTSGYISIFVFVMQNNNYDNLKALEGQYFTHSLSEAGKWLHYKLLLVEPGYIEASILIRDDMTNPWKQLHGGIISMISDELCGLSFYSLGHDTFYTTISLNIDYLFSASAGINVIVKARVIRSGKRIANVECYLFDEEERIIAHATTNLMNTGSKIFNLTIGNS